MIFRHRKEGTWHESRVCLSILKLRQLCCAMMRMLYKAFSLVDLESSSRNHL